MIIRRDQVRRVILCASAFSARLPVSRRLCLVKPTTHSSVSAPARHGAALDTAICIHHRTACEARGRETLGACTGQGWHSGGCVVTVRTLTDECAVSLFVPGIRKRRVISSACTWHNVFSTCMVHTHHHCDTNCEDLTGSVISPRCKTTYIYVV